MYCNRVRGEGVIPGERRLMRPVFETQGKEQRGSGNEEAG